MKEMMLNPTPVQKQILDRHMATLKIVLQYAAKADQSYKKYADQGLLPDEEIDVKLWHRLINHRAWENPLLEQTCGYMRKQFALNTFAIADIDWSIPRAALKPGLDCYMLWLEWHPAVQWHWNNGRHLFLPAVGMISTTSFGEKPKKLSTLILQHTKSKTSVWHK